MENSVNYGRSHLGFCLYWIPGHAPKDVENKAPCGAPTTKNRGSRTAWEGDKWVRQDEEN